jgi:hypothetical protein
LYGSEENVAAPATLADYDAAGLCANGGSVARAMGCGKIAIRDSVVLAGSAPTFDAKSKALVGVYAFSDIPFGPCGTNAYVFGQALFPPGTVVARDQDVCSDITYCHVCGPDFRNYPRCRE